MYENKMPRFPVRSFLSSKEKVSFKSEKIIDYTRGKIQYFWRREEDPDILSLEPYLHEVKFDKGVFVKKMWDDDRYKNRILKLGEDDNDQFMKLYVRGGKVNWSKLKKHFSGVEFNFEPGLKEFKIMRGKIWRGVKGLKIENSGKIRCCHDFHMKIFG